MHHCLTIAIIITIAIADDHHLSPLSTIVADVIITMTVVAVTHHACSRGIIGAFSHVIVSTDNSYVPMIATVTLGLVTVVTVSQVTVIVMASLGLSSSLSVVWVQTGSRNSGYLAVTVTVQRP